MPLDKQIQIYSVDTGNFYSGKEKHLHWMNHKLRIERKQLRDGFNKKRNDGTIHKIVGLKEIEEKLAGYDVALKDAKMISKGEYDMSVFDEENMDSIELLVKEYIDKKNLIALKNKQIKKVKDELLKMLSNKVEENIRTNGTHHIRTLNEDELSEKNVISVFDSYFTRTIGAQPDNLCEDFMVIQVYYFDIIKDLIYNGFMYKGEKYVYFTSSAGQIRTKKTVFVKESVWKKYEKSIMCGLTMDKINEKGGNNPNKHLAYLALANSATDVWEEFDIDKTIVIDDFETDVFGTYDLVDDEDYSITRVSDYVPIPHTDGAGMMLPCMGKNRMVRLPWVKGLLGVFDYKKFIEVNNCSPVIKDIYGKEHDVIEEDIQIIFTKSQFKMWKYYDSWEQYKEYYKKYNCTAGCTNIEEDRIKDATINYQMLQTLTDITDEEIDEIANQSTSKLKNLCGSINNIKDVFGVTPYNTNKTAFQKAIELYPDILNDEYAKSHLRSIKDSMVKRYKAGKLQVHGKYTFILPDFYAACEYWFLGIENPKGLLGDGEVFCWLFRKNDKLDCLRSPHLFVEHAVRNNIAWSGCAEKRDELREWFCTDAVYTSTHDMISKILQFDVDGDKSLVVADKTLIKVAERNMKKYDIVPLYYNMKKASPVQLNSESIYAGLNAAFTGGNIGIYSNNISKIWNSEVFISGTEEEKRQAVDIVKLLCMENNFVIDYAKTLYKPERPEEIHEVITGYTKENLPHFFTFAKDKDDAQVVDVNDSFVNKLNSVIPNPRINCRSLGLGKIDYNLMMNNPEIECRVKQNNGRFVESETDPLIIKYCELNKEYCNSINNMVSIDAEFSLDDSIKSRQKQALKHNQVYAHIRDELSQFGYDDIEVADILIKYLYGIKQGKDKMALWLCYGDIIVENLERYFKPQMKSVQCEDCGLWFEVVLFDSATCRCEECQREYKKKLKREQNKRAYERRKNSVSTL